MKKILHILLMLIVFSIFQKVSASTLNYDEILNQAANNSFDLKLSEIDIGISKAQLKAARSDWYPTLSVQFNTEYNRDLAEGRGNYAYAGNTMITPYTQFRDMLYLTLSYNLFDFGVTGKKVHIAKKELEQKKISYEIQLKEMKLKLLELYTKTQQCHNEITTKSQILTIYENMFHNKERMYTAGINSKLSVMDEAVKIAKMQNDIEKSKLELKNTLKDITFYTAENYDITNLTVNEIKNDTEENNIIPVNYNETFKSSAEKLTFDGTFNPEYSLEAAYYNLEIDKKKAELSILKRQLLPSFRFYTGYSLYGQNPNNYYQSVKDIEQRSLIVGISSTYVLFDGFKNRANREKTTLEIQKIQYEKEKKLSELKKQYEKSFQSYESFNEELSINQNLLSTVKEKLQATERLSAGKLVEQNELLDVRANLFTQEFELEQNIIDINSKIKELKIISGVDI